MRCNKLALTHEEVLRCAALRSEILSLAKVAPPACLNTGRQDRLKLVRPARTKPRHPAQKPLKAGLRARCLGELCRRKVAPPGCADYRSGRAPLASRSRLSAGWYLSIR